MTPNKKLINLLRISEFEKLRLQGNLQSTWCESQVFLFNEVNAILFQDIIQEDEVDVFLYHRKSRSSTFNLYGVADFLLNNAIKDSMSEILKSYRKSIDFNVLNIFAERKKQSLAFGFALLASVGDRIWSLSPQENALLFTPVLDIVSSRWEKCMSNCCCPVQTSKPSDEPA